MKGRILLITVLIIVMVAVIAGCNNDSGIDPAELYEKSVKAVEEANSYEFEMNVNQIMIFPEEIPLGNGEVTDRMETQAKGTGKALIDPLEMEMVMEMNIPAMAGMPEAEGLGEMEIKLYMVDDMVYMTDPMFGDWIMIDMNAMGMGMEQLEGLDKSSNDPLYFLEMLGEEGAANASIESDAQHYIMSITDEEGTLIKNIMDEVVNQLFGDIPDPAMQDELSEIFEGMDISEIEYKVWVDKETYLTTKTYMAFSMSMTIEGETLMMEQEAESVYANYGTIDSINIPDEVKESAVNMEDTLF